MLQHDKTGIRCAIHTPPLPPQFPTRASPPISHKGIPWGRTQEVVDSLGFQSLIPPLSDKGGLGG